MLVVWVDAHRQLNKQVRRKSGSQAVPSGEACKRYFPHMSGFLSDSPLTTYNIGGYESRYSSLEKACLSLVWATQRLRHYMLAYQVWLLSGPIEVSFREASTIRKDCSMAAVVIRVRHHLCHAEILQGSSPSCILKAPPSSSNQCLPWPVLPCSYLHRKRTFQSGLLPFINFVYSREVLTIPFF